MKNSEKPIFFYFFIRWIRQFANDDLTFEDRLWRIWLCNKYISLLLLVIITRPEYECRLGQQIRLTEYLIQNLQRTLLWVQWALIIFRFKYYYFEIHTVRGFLQGQGDWMISTVLNVSYCKILFNRFMNEFLL